MSGSLSQPNTASMTVASGNAGVFPIGYGYYPPEGSRAVSAQYNFADNGITTGQTFYEDLSQLVARGVETSIQSAYIDNTANNYDVTITLGGSGQTLLIPADSSGIFPLFFTGTPNLYISCPGSINKNGGTQSLTRVTYLNVPGSTGMLGQAFDNVQSAQASIYLANAGGTIKNGPGRVFTVTVTVAIAVGTVTVSDNANVLLVIPTGTLAGAVYTLGGVPCLSNIKAAFLGGATGTIAIFYS